MLSIELLMRSSDILRVSVDPDYCRKSAITEKTLVDRCCYSFIDYNYNYNSLNFDSLKAMSNY